MQSCLFHFTIYLFGFQSFHTLIIAIYRILYSKSIFSTFGTSILHQNFKMNTKMCIIKFLFKYNLYGYIFMNHIYEKLHWLGFSY